MCEKRPMTSNAASSSSSSSSSSTSSTTILFQRCDALATFRQWFANCGQSLAIVGPSASGKTCFARQLSRLPECVASHFCRCDEPQSSESATVIRSLGDQLKRRFPNLVLPRLSTVTMLRETATSLEHFLQMPLETMPRPAKPVFMIIDGGDNSIGFRKIVEMIRLILPRWIRIVITIRKSNPEYTSDMHIFEISDCDSDLERFIRLRLPNFHSKQISNAADGSWFYVDQFARAVDAGIIPNDLTNVPKCTEDLLELLTHSLPPCFPDLIRLAKACRSPPTCQQILAAGQILLSQDATTLDRDIRFIHQLIHQTSTADDNNDQKLFDVADVWFDYVGDDPIRCHQAWSEHFKTKRRKTAQDIVELAFHLAHSSSNPINSIRTLQSVGATKLLLQCPVIDHSTTDLLASAGATIDDQNSDIVYACSLGDVEYLEKIIQKSKPSNIDICYGLLTAAARGNLDTCRFIVDNYPTSIIVSSSCCGEWNALRSAACNGQLQVLTLLLSKGVNVDECGHSDRTALRAAAWSGQLAAVQLLLETGADVDRRDSEQRTALMAAAFMDHHDVVSVILQYGADINATDKSRATALHLNLSNGSKDEEHRKTTQLLVESGASCTIEDANGRVALHLAAYHGDKNLEKILGQSSGVDVQDHMGQTPLILAASQGQQEAVKYLVEIANADVDCIDTNGRTALQWAAINGHPETVNYLIGVGSDEAHKDNDGAVALHYAVLHDDVELVENLINDVTIKATDRYGQHPLLLACEHGNQKVISTLIDHSAPINLAALDGRTPLSVAAMSGHTTVIDLLAPYIIDWIQTDHDGTPLIHTLILSNQISTAEALLRHGVHSSCISARDAHGRSCAHVVASTNDVNAAKMLRRCGASFEVVDDGGRTALTTAIWSRNSQITFYLLDTCAVDPNRSDHQGATALSIAAQLGDRELVAMLLRFGAEPNVRDTLGRTPLDVAMISGHEVIAAMLKSANGSSDSSGIGSSVPNSPMDVGKMARNRRSNSSARPKVF